MPKYKAILSEKATTFLDGLPKPEVERIVKRIILLEENPQSVGERRSNFMILKIGTSGYRASFTINEKTKEIHIAAIEKRGSRKYDNFYR